MDYLLKPIDQERFKLAVKRALDRLQLEQNPVGELLRSLKTENKTVFDSHIFVQKSEKLINLPVEEIMFLEASGDYTILTTKSDQFVSSSGIGKLEEILNPEVFIRVHRSTIININYLKEIERHFNGGMMVKMSNGKKFSGKPHLCAGNPEEGGLGYNQSLRVILFCQPVTSAI